MIDADDNGVMLTGPGIIGTWRTERNRCNVNPPDAHPGNLVLFGNNVTFEHNESIYALCGSGLGLSGSGLTIIDNFISFNGRDKFHPEVLEGSPPPCDIGAAGCAPWSDGITSLSCGPNSEIAWNVLDNNTDFDLIIGPGGGCHVHHNTIRHGGNVSSKYAFAGLN